MKQGNSLACATRSDMRIYALEFGKFMGETTALPEPGRYRGGLSGALHSPNRHQ